MMSVKYSRAYAPLRNAADFEMNIEKNNFQSADEIKFLAFYWAAKMGNRDSKRNLNI